MTTKLNDYVELNPRVLMDKGQTVPFVAMDVVMPGKRWVRPEEDRPATGSGSKFAPGDTLFARITPCLENGKIAQYAGDRPGMGSTEFFVLRARANISDPAFVFYFSQNRDLRASAEKSMSGASGRQRADISSLSEFECEFPPLPVQRRIADILSAYDELIENNRRRIRILEEIARALYREWFVHFRFPGQETIKWLDSTLGIIPAGWQVKKLGDFVQFRSGFAFKSGSFTVDGKYRLVTIKNVQDGSFNPESGSRMDELPEKLPPYCVLNDGDILLSLTGNVGRVCLVYDGPFLLNQRVAKLTPAEGFDWAMTYCMFRETAMRVRLEQLSNGVAQQNLSPVLTSKMEVAGPPCELRQRFAALAEPMVRRIVQLYSAVQNLRRTRDLLLPRLLSGQLNLEPD